MKLANQHRQPFIFAVYLGRQPSATAIKLKTLNQQGWIPTEIICAVNDTTRGYFEKLQTWWSNAFPNAVVPWTEILDSDFLSEVQRRLEEDAELNIIFDADTGFALNISQFIKQHVTERISYMNAERQSLLLSDYQNKVEQFSLTHLGLDTLLGLYGLKQKHNPQISSDKAKERTQFAAELLQTHSLNQDQYAGPFQVDGSSIVFDLGFELFGRLYVFSMIELKKSQAVKSELTYEIRNHISQFNIRQLQPQLGLALYDNLMNPDLSSEERLKREERLNFICDLSPHVTPLKSQSECVQWLQSLLGQARHELVVCLGSNLSSSLAAICTYQPSKVWLIYDQNDNLSQIQIDKIIQLEPFLKLRFKLIPTTFKAIGLYQQLIQLPQQTDSPVHFEVGPGSKIMTRVMTQAYGFLEQQAQGKSHKLTCLHYESSQYTDLNTGQTEKLSTHTLPYLVYLFDSKHLPNQDSDMVQLMNFENNKVFLEKLYNKFDAEVRQNKTNYKLSDFLNALNKFNIQNITTKHQQSISFKSQDKRFAFIQYPVMSQQKLKTAGLWFEYIVAAQWMKVIEQETQPYYVWQNLESFNPNQNKRCELDVVAAWKGVVFCCSCKSGNYQKATSEETLSELQQPMLEILAETRIGFGYKAIPVLVVPTLPKEIIQEAKKLEPQIQIWTLQNLATNHFVNLLNALTQGT